MTHGKTLVEANIRNYKGSTEINAQILATIRDEPEYFFRHAVSNGGKPWQYLLIPHDVITEKMTIAGLASSFRVD